MRFENILIDLDYLVYSSHKSATQTLVQTMNNNGFKCRHCHFLPNIGLSNGDFQLYLESYLEKNNRKSNVITVFREPMERHISSFFQGYGSRPLRLKEVDNEFETIIYRNTIEQLQHKFISELADKSLIGYPESIHDICQELQIKVEELNYSEETGFGLYETSKIKLYIFRFDTLVKNIETLLHDVTGKKIVKKNMNLSDLKFYKDKYSEFKASLVVPRHIILDVYNSKRNIINLLYSGNFDSILNQALIKYVKV